jgi:MerR family transcriptional regulator, light-induced transcriptional regulator
VNLESAAKVLGVHYQTAYRWVRTGQLPAAKVGSAYELLAEDVERLAEERRAQAGRAPAGSPDWVKEQERLYDAFVAAQPDAAGLVVDDLVAAGITASDLCDRLLAPVLRWLGDDDLLVPGQVAAAAEICEEIAGRLAAPPRGRPKGLAVVASPAGEQHRLPSLMATVALRGDRWRVHHLGADVPEDELRDFVAEARPDVVVLSLTVTDGPAAGAAARLAAGVTVPLVVGEPGRSLADLLEAVNRVVRPGVG